MKRHGLLTIIDYTNYGNRLQNYALEFFLKSLGSDIETINYNRETIGKFDKLKKIPGLSILNTWIKSAADSEYKLEIQKIENFKRFTKKNMTINDKEFDIQSDFSVLDHMYSHIVVGSDQVWKPKRVLEKTEHFFLPSIKKEKCVAYAPSFGISSIPEDLAGRYKEWINGFQYLSVREEAGQKIIEDLTGREAPVLLDPTLLLSKEEWRVISRPHFKKPKKNYILTYFLGEAKEESKEMIERLSTEHDMDVVNLADIEDSDRYTADPGEFLDYIDSCSILFTDSFHGSVFSIIFEKPFVVFKRGDMNSRIKTLLSKFRLTERKWENIKEKHNFFDIDFSHKEDIMNREKNRSINYIEEALKIDID